MRDEEGWAEPGVGRVAESGVRSYEDLRVWQEGISLCELVYGATRAFPKDERFGLTSQLCRAAVSIPSNIAEGWGRGSTQDYARFLRIARGSLYEVRTQLIVAERVGLLTAEGAAPLLQHIDHVRRMLHGLIRSLGA
ncbi:MULTISPECIES: four helix bundle protein [Rubrivirga]|uniref:four helix bundle protein n=1 Tax=Rubrivirga TaxID=1434037 RepID=UPI0032C21FD0